MRIKEFIRRMTYDPKHTKPTDENILHLLLPSIIGILMCMACVAGLTWAWFSSSVSTGTQNIVAANFSIEATVAGMDTAADGCYTFEAGNEYRVTLTASGSASQGGYCVIKTASGKQYYTAHISMDAPFELTIKPTETETYTFTGVWGTHVKDENNPELENGAVIPIQESIPEVKPPQNDVPDAKDGNEDESAPAVDKPAVKPDEPKTDPSQETEDITPPSVSQPEDQLPSEQKPSDNTDISSADTEPQPPEDTEKITEGASETASPPPAEDQLE